MALIRAHLAREVPALEAGVQKARDEELAFKAGTQG
jgi:hypothetical protein